VNIHLFSMISLDENEYPDLNLYRHFIDYYIKLGVDPNNFNIIPCGRKKAEKRVKLYSPDLCYNTYHKNLDEFRKINDQNNIPNLELVSKKYDIQKAHDILIKWQWTIDDEDWIILPDADEFNDYGPFNTIPECANFLEENNYSALRGSFEDRVAEDLILHKVRYPEDLFEQFSKKASITRYVIGATWTKILLFKAKVEVGIGHHDVVWVPAVNSAERKKVNINRHDEDYWNYFYAPKPTPGVYDPDDIDHSRFKVRHFKWTDTLIHRLKNPNKHNELYYLFNKDRRVTKGIITDNKFAIDRYLSKS